MAFNIFALSIVILQSSFIAHITTARSVCIVQWAAVGIRYQKCYSSLNDSDFPSLSFGCFQHAHKIYIDLISPRTNSLMFRFFLLFSPSVRIVLSSFVVIMDWFSLMDQSEFFSCLFSLITSVSCCYQLTLYCVSVFSRLAHTPYTYAAAAAVCAAQHPIMTTMTFSLFNGKSVCFFLCSFIILFLAVY